MLPAADALLFDGATLSLRPLEHGFVELRFDRREGGVNMFDRRTVAELDAAGRELEPLVPEVRGILVSSAKDMFIVGADITEFTATFALPRPQLLDYLRRSNEVFLRFEALDLPMVAAINGFALGGGLEFALVASHRVMARGARIGLPEIGLGLIPGFGGTIRLPRAATFSDALDWIADGQPRDAEAALRCGAVDRICEPAELRDEALALLRRAADTWRERREAKRRRVALADDALDGLIAQRLQACSKTVPPWLPAASTAIDLVGRSARMCSAEAQEAEALAFATLAKSQPAAALVRHFINQQAVRRLARELARAPETGEAPASEVPHFASPLPGATLVEIATGSDSDPAAVARVASQALAAGRMPIRVMQGSEGVTRRVHAACMRACAELLRQGASAEAIDAAMIQAGWSIGPFAADELLRRNASQPPARGTSNGSPPAADSIVRHVLQAYVAEAARVVAEGVVGTPAEADMATLLGLGFPRHLGGPLHHADWLGPAQWRELGRNQPFYPTA